jgi:hypothetical protein
MIKARILFSVAALQICSSIGAEPPSSPFKAVEIEGREGGHWKHKCRGTLVGNFVLTARHCISDLKWSLNRSIRAYVDKQELRLLNVKNPAEVNGSGAVRSALFDFVFLETDLPASKSIMSAPIPQSALFGKSVKILKADGDLATCTVTDVCGAAFYLGNCQPSHPAKGWSGSGIWLDQSEPAFAGVLTDIDNQITDHGARATGIWTIVGRSSFLLGEKLYYETFRRNKKYQYLTEGPSCEARRIGRLKIDRLTEGNATASAPLRVDYRTIVYADNFYGNLVVYDVIDSRVLSATPIPDDPARLKVTYPIRSNAIWRLSDNEFAIAQSGPVGEPGGIQPFRLDLASPQPIPIFSARRTTSVGHTVLSVAKVGEQILIGGEDGICRLTTLSCDRLSANLWSVLAIINIRPDRAIAIGRDFSGRGKAAIRFPAFSEVTVTSDGANLGAITLVRDAPNQQFNVGAKFGDLFIAFGSNGAAFDISTPKYRRIIVDGLYNDSDRIEDSIRGAVFLDDKHLGIVGTDGGFRILSASLMRRRLQLSAQNTVSANDLAVSLSGLALDRQWAVTATQDGSLLRIRCRLPTTDSGGLANC